MGQVPISDLAVDELERLARALIAQLSPLAGTRASGLARVVSTGPTVSIRPNTYAIPVHNGAERTNTLVKVAPNPATAREHAQGGEWEVTPGGADIQFVTNVGGNWSVPAGATLRFNPPIDGLVPTATVIASDPIDGGTCESALVNQVVIYDEIDNQQNAEIARSASGKMPLVQLAWMRGFPIDGRQGPVAPRTRKGRGVRMYQDEWALTIFTDNATSARARWSEGVRILQAVDGLLGDRKVNDDGERLSQGPKGVEIMLTQRLRIDAVNVQAFFMMFRTQVARHVVTSGREFQPWMTTMYRGYAPAEPPEHEEDLEIASPVDPMPRT